MIFGNRYIHELSINGTQVTDDKGLAGDEENQNTVTENAKAKFPGYSDVANKPAEKF